MKILEVYLEGYKRLKLNKVNSIRIVPTELIQIIIGTNGAGKSSVQEQVNVWVADRKDFMVGGKKIVKVEHNGSIYETRQFFNKKNATFEFIKDEENLNDGNTGSVQKELIHRHFNIDQDIMDLFLGKVRFTKMNPTQRREMLTKISGIDLTYAIGLFKRVASAGRDVQGAKKLIDKRLINETSNIWKDEDWNSWRDSQKNLTDTLTALMSLSDPKVRPHGVVEDEYQACLARMKNLVNKFMDEYMDYDDLSDPDNNIATIDDIYSNLSEMKGKRSTLSDNKKDIMVELESLQEELTELTRRESIDIGEWSNIKQQVTANLSVVTTTKMSYDWQHFDVTYLDLLSTVESELSEFVLDRTKEDFKPIVTRSEYETHVVELETLKKSYSSNKVLVDRMACRRDDIMGAKEETCPKCSHTYVPGVSENELEDLKTRVINGVKWLDDCEEKINKIQELVDNFKTCEQNTRNVRNILNGFRMFNMVWDSVIEDNILETNPTMILNYINDARTDLNLLLDKQRLEAKLHEAESMLIKAGENSGLADRMESINRREQALSDRLNANVEAMTSLEKNVTSLEAKRGRAEFVQKAETVINEILTQYNELTLERVDALREQTLREDIAQHQVQLASVTRSIQSQETQRGIVKDLEQQSAKLGEESELWKELTQNLSPTTGIIAEQLMGFINNLTDSMNRILEQLWEHEIRILPCKGLGDNLDYKFPIIIDGDDPNDDISLTSTGQTDVIDFVFVLVARAYLDMEDFPLYTDELGSSFDEEHKENLQRFLKLLCDSSNCSQLWIISHAYGVHNSLGASETIVIDSSNITVPSRYNEHVEFG